MVDDEFETPFALHVRKRCRVCREVVWVTLMNGATEPRDGFYTCAECLKTPPATAEAVEQMPRPQLELVEGSDGG